VNFSSLCPPWFNEQKGKEIMKERIIVKSVVGLLIAVVVVATRNTDLIYVGAAVLFFAICVAYAEWCERL
jgi:hypothetical protein